MGGGQTGPLSLGVGGVGQPAKLQASRPRLTLRDRGDARGDARTATEVAVAQQLTRQIGEESVGRGFVQLPILRFAELPIPPRSRRAAARHERRDPPGVFFAHLLQGEGVHVGVVAEVGGNRRAFEQHRGSPGIFGRDPSATLQPSPIHRRRADVPLRSAPPLSGRLRVGRPERQLGRRPGSRGRSIDHGRIKGEVWRIRIAIADDGVEPGIIAVEVDRLPNVGHVGPDQPRLLGIRTRASRRRRDSERDERELGEAPRSFSTKRGPL